MWQTKGWHDTNGCRTWHGKNVVTHHFEKNHVQCHFGRKFASFGEGSRNSKSIYLVLPQTSSCSQLSAIWGNSFWFLVISLASSLSFLMNFVMARHEFSSMLKKSYGKRSDRCRFDVMKIMEVIRVVLVGGEQSDQFFIFEFETTPLDLEVYFSKF